MLKAVIFDMDGVLIDSHPIHKKAWRRFLASAGKTVSDEQLDFVLDGRKREEILTHFLGPLTPQQVTEYGHRKEQLFREEARHVGMVAGIEKFLDEIEQANIPMAIASSGSSSRVRLLLDRPALRNRFAAVVTGDDVSQGKPDPAIFKKAAEAVGTPFPDTLVVEDAVAGVVAAKSVGMWCLAIASNGRGTALRAAGADEVAPDFRSVRFASLLRRFS
jgi:beta-phosphoglucomutase